MRSPAFSLIELSIVLVILGLLTGGILAGQSLIRAAELRSVTAQTQRYLTTVYTFRDKYFALPGDMANATRFWGAAHATPATCYTTDSRTLSDPKLTCDGNGTGIVADTGGNYYERFRFWQHLANAGLIEGSYSGIMDTSSLDNTPGINAPSGKIPNSGYSIYYQYDATGASFFNTMPITKHLIYFGGERVGNTFAPILVPSEAWNIDTKVDDGNPATGRIINHIGSSPITPNCTNGDVEATAAYSLTLSDKLCGIILLPGF